MSRERRSYTAYYKLQVIMYAEMSSNVMAARFFGVHEKQVRDWRKKRQELADMKNKIKMAERGRRPLFPAMEEELARWILKLKKNNVIVTHTEIRLKALEIIKKPEFAESTSVDFIASKGWCNRFLRR